jgi:hypothetical protein
LCSSTVEPQTEPPARSAFVYCGRP